jgi:hypothetical protein
MYKPLQIITDEVGGLTPALESMRYPMEGRKSTKTNEELSIMLYKRGDEHAKHLRGIMVWATLQYGLGFGIELETYTVGVTRLCSTSSMHQELRRLTGVELAEQKQMDLPDKYYKRGYIFSYQTLARMYNQRKNHRHPDWWVFCAWVLTLPMFTELTGIGGVYGMS